MAKKKKGITIRGYKSKSKKQCKFGVNKNSGKCLKHPRKKK